MRTAMVAVYTLFNVDRGVPEVWCGPYDIRDPLKATVSLRDGNSIAEMDIGLAKRSVLKTVLEKIEEISIEKLLKEYHVI